MLNHQFDKVGVVGIQRRFQPNVSLLQESVSGTSNRGAPLKENQTFTFKLLHRHLLLICQRMFFANNQNQLILKELGDMQSRRIDGDRKSTRLNSSHDQISYAVFCLKKKKKKKKTTQRI